QLGVPDMRLPIQYALAHPRRLSAPAERLDLTRVAKLTFDSVDAEKYPCLALAYRAGQLGGTAPTVLNAANEVAVARLLAEELRSPVLPGFAGAAVGATAPTESRPRKGLGPGAAGPPHLPPAGAPRSL